MPLFSKLDLIALVWFVVAWLGYAVLIEMTAHGKSGLNAQMHRYRDLWMERMLAREARMVDGQIIAGLQNGTAFFASTSLIALGGSATLLHSTEDMLTVIAALPFGEAVTHTQWELKVVGLMIIFIYAFFKFAWSYRLYNYVGIMVGAAPPPPNATSRKPRPMRNLQRRSSPMPAAISIAASAPSFSRSVILAAF